ncbi:hypothetical protein [Saccharopolyspora sp. NPDC049426]|uniref:hypothetical protein n=1 Tax=Saccharopolyspora sp. NPDC049426 TaxID=3155652 RepID=UPI003427DA0A
MWPFDDIGSAIGGKLKELVSSAFETAMQALWDASLWILREAFRLADQFSVFTVDTREGPISVLWPMMLWISGALALGLFFWQMTTTSLRGGRGFMRLVGGPVQYGIALAITVGMVAGFLTAADGLTHGILQYGLQSTNFQDALQHTTFADAAQDGVKAVALGICAFIGVIPAGIGYVLEMLFREAAIYVLVATIPITAAGLLANVTKAWFWKAIRWILACIAMKPVLAMTLVLGVAISGGSKGLSGLLAGVGVLIISLLIPFVLFRLFAFVDPNSDAGSTFRDALSGVGVSSYGSGNPAIQAANALAGGGFGGGSSGSDAQESANADRFDEAMADYADGEMDNHGIGHSSGGSSGGGGSGGGGSGGGGGQSSASPPADPGGDGDDDVLGGDGAAAPPAAANSGRVTSSDGIGPQGVGGGDDGGDGGGGGGGSAGGGYPEPPPPEPPDYGHRPDDDGGGGGPRGGGGGGGPKNNGGGGGAAASDDVEAAVVV